MKLKVAKNKEQKDKIVILNSGGFDSVVLAHEVNYLNPDTEIHNLFFNCGQLCVNEERRCSTQCAEKLGFIFKEFTLPEFNWSNSVLNGGKDSTQYIPHRNLVFMSYAISYAEAIGAKKIYLALVQSPDGVYYTDTTAKFIEDLNRISKDVGIQIEAPFLTQSKEGLLKSLARNYGIMRKDVHSCNFSDSGCGECPDCITVGRIFDDIERLIPDDILIDNGFSIVSDVIEGIKQCKVRTLKVYLNNSCQFSCKHCFIGNQELVSEPLSLNEWRDVIRQASEIGIERIDFFGKEPLFDDTVFELMDECQKYGIKYSIITNGVNVKKYIKELSKYKPSVTISVENVKTTKLRNKGDYVIDTLKLLIDNGIQTSVSIDLSTSNHKDLKKIVQKISSIGVANFYVKPIRPFGEHEDYLMSTLISSSEILDAIDDLSAIQMKTGVSITMSLSQGDLYRMYHDCTERFLDNAVGYCIVNRLDECDGIIFETELYCHRFKDSVAITPDGYVLGCASEYCSDYSACEDLREMTLKDCIDIGKDSLNMMCTQFSCVGCYLSDSYKEKGVKIFS